MAEKQRSEERGTYEVAGRTYESIRVSILKKTDIGQNDRIYVKTESGNRYMIRWSKTINAPKIYSERTDFKDGYPLVDQYPGDTPIAEVGKPFLFMMMVKGPDDGNLGQKMETAKVMDIEIRKDSNIDIPSHASNFGSLINQMNRGVTGRVDHENPPL